MEEPKNPCHACGGAKTQSRREFLQNAAVLGAGLSLTGAVLTASTEANAAIFSFDYERCIADAQHAHESCLVAAQQPAGGGVANRAIRFAKRVACDAAFAADVAGCDAALAAEIAKEIALLPYNPNSTTVVTIGLIEIIIIILGGIIIFV